jgi:hypothetical protein
MEHSNAMLTPNQSIPLCFEKKRKLKSDTGQHSKTIFNTFGDYEALTQIEPSLYGMTTFLERSTIEPSIPIPLAPIQESSKTN